MSELEQMGKTLMETALNFTHPRFEATYPEWGAVCNIGEELVRMSQQSELNENQQVVLELLQKAYAKNKWMTPFGAVFSVANENDFAIRAWLTKEEQFKVLAAFADWEMKEVAE